MLVYIRLVQSILGFFQIFPRLDRKFGLLDMDLSSLFLCLFLFVGPESEISTRSNRDLCDHPFTYTRVEKNVFSSDIFFVRPSVNYFEFVHTPHCIEVYKQFLRGVTTFTKFDSLCGASYEVFDKHPWYDLDTRRPVPSHGQPFNVSDTGECYCVESFRRGFKTFGVFKCHCDLQPYVSHTVDHSGILKSFFHMFTRFGAYLFNSVLSLVESLIHTVVWTLLSLGLSFFDLLFSFVNEYWIFFHLPNILLLLIVSLTVEPTSLRIFFIIILGLLYFRLNF